MKNMQINLKFLVSLILLLRKHRGSNSKHRILHYTLAAFMVGLELTYQIWWGVTRGGELRAIPLGLCAITMWLTVIALVFDSTKLTEIILPWAVVVLLLSLVVDIEGGYIFLRIRFIHYFLIHTIFSLVNLAYLFSGRIRPYDYRDLLKSSLVLAVLAVIVAIIDFVIPANHMFMRETPAELAFIHEVIKSPWHAPILAACIFALMNILYLPIHFSNKKVRVKPTIQS